MKLVVAEKNIAAQKIAQLLSTTKPKNDKVYNTQVYRFEVDGEEWVSMGLAGHILAPDFPDDVLFDKKQGWYSVTEDGEVLPADIPDGLARPPYDTKRKPYLANGISLKGWKVESLPYLTWAPVLKKPAEKEIIRVLKNLAKKADEVIIATDFDREGELIGSDARNDLAVIKISASGLTPATLGDSDMLTVGEDVVAIGNPLGELRGTSTGGMVSALGREVSVEGTMMTLIQHDAAVSPGSSGGGLFNSSGSLIGIVNAKANSSEAEGIGFAIPVNSVKQIISDLIEHGYVQGRAYLGVSTQNVTLMPQGTSQWGGFFGYSGMSCVLVTNVVSGSAAEAAGIRTGDLILAVEGTEVSSTDDLSALINAYNAGDQATLTIQRNGEQMELSVTFGESVPEK